VAQRHGDQILVSIRFTIRFRVQLLQKILVSSPGGSTNFGGDLSSLGTSTFLYANNIETVKVSRSFLAYFFQALCCVIGQTSLKRNLVFVRAYIVKVFV